MCCIVLYDILFYCVVLYCIISYCIAQHHLNTILQYMVVLYLTSLLRKLVYGSSLKSLYFYVCLFVLISKLFTFIVSIHVSML